VQEQQASKQGMAAGVGEAKEEERANGKNSNSPLVCVTSSKLLAHP